jgi:hypothetical protein
MSASRIVPVESELAEVPPAESELFLRRLVTLISARSPSHPVRPALGVEIGGGSGGGQRPIESKCPDPRSHRQVCVRQGSRRSGPAWSPKVSGPDICRSALGETSCSVPHLSCSRRHAAGTRRGVKRARRMCGHSSVRVPSHPVPLGPGKCPDRIFVGLRSVKQRVPSRPQGLSPSPLAGEGRGEGGNGGRGSRLFESRPTGPVRPRKCPDRIFLGLRSVKPRVPSRPSRRSADQSRSTWPSHSRSGYRQGARKAPLSTARILSGRDRGVSFEPTAPRPGSRIPSFYALINDAGIFPVSKLTSESPVSDSRKSAILSSPGRGGTPLATGANPWYSSSP